LPAGGFLGGGFDIMLYCVYAFESDVYVCVFKEIGKFSDF